MHLSMGWLRRLIGGSRLLCDQDSLSIDRDSPLNRPIVLVVRWRLTCRAAGCAA
jgi:hypothetical protein